MIEVPCPACEAIILMPEQITRSTLSCSSCDHSFDWERSAPGEAGAARVAEPSSSSVEAAPESAEVAARAPAGEAVAPPAEVTDEEAEGATEVEDEVEDEVEELPAVPAAAVAEEVELKLLPLESDSDGELPALEVESPSSLQRASVTAEAAPAVARAARVAKAIPALEAPSRELDLSFAPDPEPELNFAEPELDLAEPELASFDVGPLPTKPERVIVRDVEPPTFDEMPEPDGGGTIRSLTLAAVAMLRFPWHTQLVGFATVVTLLLLNLILFFTLSIFLGEGSVALGRISNASSGLFVLVFFAFAFCVIVAANGVVLAALVPFCRQVLAGVEPSFRALLDPLRRAPQVFAWTLASCLLATVLAGVALVPMSLVEKSFANGTIMSVVYPAIACSLWAIYARIIAAVPGYIALQREDDVMSLGFGAWRYGGRVFVPMWLSGIALGVVILGTGYLYAMALERGSFGLNTITGRNLFDLLALACGILVVPYLALAYTRIVVGCDEER